MIDQPFSASSREAPSATSRSKQRHLAVGAGAAGDDGPRVLDLGGAAERLGVLAQQDQQLVDQVAERHQLALAEIEQRAGNAVALRPPAVLRRAGTAG